MSLTPEEINELLAKTRDQKFRNKSDAQLLGYEQSRYSNKEFKKLNPLTEEQKYACGNNLRGKKLEEILGEERAIKGKQIRVKSASHPRPLEIVNKIINTKKLNKVYESENHGMRNKTHTESTKETMAIKATIRQELKRKLGLGKADKVPKELLEEEYKKHNL